jgi:phosphate transport system substrate-binding protein
VQTQHFVRCGLLSVVLVSSIWSSACQRGISGAPIRIDGSSTLYPLTVAVRDQFREKNPNAEIDVKFSGTDAGFATFCNGESDLQDASRPIEENEIAVCRSSNVHFIELPVAYDGLTVIVHPSNTWADSITVPELKKLWEPSAAGKVTRWSHVRRDWPDRPIALFGPGSASGTFDFFTAAVVGDERSSRKDYSASEDDEVIVKSVADEPGALAYVGYSYYDRSRDKVKALKVDDLDDSIGRGPIEPSPDNVRRGLYRPLTRPLFIYVNTDRMARAEVKAFVDFYVRQSPGLAARFEIPLNPQLYNVVQQRAIQRVEGSVYEAPGAKERTLDQLLNQ